MDRKAGLPSRNHLSDMPVIRQLGRDLADLTGVNERIGLIWSDRVNLRNLWVCRCRFVVGFSRTKPAAVGAVLSDD